MTTLTTRSADDSKLRTGSAIMALAGVGFIGYGAIFFVLNFVGSGLELGIGSGQVNVSTEQITDFSPQLNHYMEHLHIALSGFIAAAGVAVAALAWYGVRRGEWWAWVTAVVVPVFALAVALPAHYPWGFDTIGHLGLIYLDTLLFVVGAALAYVGIRRPSTSG